MPRIMVVDDEAIITTQLEERLAAMGYEVAGKASSAEKCLDMARKLRPDLILMDIVMPGKLDGIEASEIIKKELGIPVVFLTAYADDDFVKRAKCTDPYGYIVKPFHEGEIKAAIEVALRRRGLERHLSESEEKYRSIIASAEDAIVSVDAQGNVELWNHAAEIMFGYTAEEIVGKPVADIVPERFRSELVKTMERAISKGGSVTIGSAIEFHGLRKDGSEFRMEISVTTWETKRGVFLTGIIRDITERKRVEEALRRSEYTMRQMTKLFVQSHEDERQQIAIEVHDRIAQTLSGAFLQLQALEPAIEKGSGAEKILPKALVLLQECIGECRNIMEYLYSPVLHDFGLIAVMDEELRDFQEATGCRAHFDARCPERPPREVEVTVYRIFREALTNVRRHAKAKEVVVTLTHRNDRVALQVKDDGQGFNPGAEMRIKQVGGLMIMRRRAELSGGTFEVWSVPGQGTTVKVQLPLSAGNET